MLSALTEVEALSGEPSVESSERIACALSQMEEALGDVDLTKLIDWGRESGVGGDVAGSMSANSVALFAVEVSLALKYDVEPYNWLLRDPALQPFLDGLLYLHATRVDLENVIFAEKCRWPSSAWDEACEAYWRRSRGWSSDSLLLHVRTLFDRLVAAWLWQEAKRVLSPFQRWRLTRAYFREYPAFRRMFKWGVRFLEEMVVPKDFFTAGQPGGN